MQEKRFYEMLAEIHNEVSAQSCGCMGHSYTPENVEKHDKFDADYNNPEKVVEGRVYPSYIKSNHTLDYIGNIIRGFIVVKK